MFEDIVQAYRENLQQLDKINADYELAVTENQRVNKELVQKLGELQAVEIKRSSSSSSSVKQLPSQDNGLELEVDVDAQVDD